MIDSADFANKQSSDVSLPDNVFLEQFEDLTLDPQHFDHLGHLRLAWLYLNEHSFIEAHEKISLGIKQYATSLGAPEKFHATLTFALSCIIAKSLDNTAPANFEAFLELNQKLIKKPMSLVNEHYSSSVLDQECSRATVCMPDIMAFDEKFKAPSVHLNGRNQDPP